MHRTFKYLIVLGTGLIVWAGQPLWAAGPPEPSPFSNPMALTLMILMLLLLIIIGILANILVGAADVKMKKREKAAGRGAIVTILLLLAGGPLFAQDAGGAADTLKTAAKTIGGLSASTFYIMAAIIFLELFVILALLINIRFLLKQEKDVLEAPEAELARKPRVSWWSRFNKFRPVEQEADIDLGHDYDGIRELDNRLPPWWLYGFYFTIIFAIVYLWRFHVSHTGPSSVEEYERAVAKAELKIKEHLKSKGEAVDENTVTYLSAAAELAEGKTIYLKSCAACHKEAGGGDVGPNLTDDYWLHGGDIKSIFKIIRYGYNAMPQWQNTYSNKQIAQVASYIKSLKGTKPPNPKAPQGELFQESAPAQPAADSAAAKVAMNQ